MDHDEDQELRRIMDYFADQTRIVDATAGMCDEIISQGERLIKDALDRAVRKGTYTFENAQNVMDLFCDRAASLRANLSSKDRTDAFNAACAAMDMMGLALAIGQGLPSDEIFELANAGFAEKERNKRGARKSAETRKSEADEMWKAHALELAIEIQAEGDFTQEDLAVKIKERWRKLGLHCPESMLVKQIRQWMNEGKLRKSTRARRARNG